MILVEMPGVEHPGKTGIAAAGTDLVITGRSSAVAMSAVRGSAVRREERLRAFLASAKDIAAGGAGRINVEKV